MSAHSVIEGSTETCNQETEGIIDEAYYELEWIEILTAVEGEQIQNQSDCPAERQVSLNSPPEFTGVALNF